MKRAAPSAMYWVGGGPTDLSQPPRKLQRGMQPGATSRTEGHHFGPFATSPLEPSDMCATEPRGEDTSCAYYLICDSCPTAFIKGT